MFAIVALAASACVALLAISMSESGDAAFPGLNGRIAYASGGSYSYSSAAIWAANADGGSPTVLAAGSGVSAPSYSADGSRIAFDREGGVAVMSASGSGQVQLLSGSDSRSSRTEWRKDYVDPHSAKVIPVVKVESFDDQWQNFDHPSFSPMERGSSSLKRAESGPTAASAPLKTSTTSNASSFPTRTPTSTTNTTATPAELT